MVEIITKKVYDELPILVKAEDDKIYQLNYYDSIGRFRRYKLLEPKNHNGSPYYRVGGVRYSEQRLVSLEKRCIKTIDLNKKVVRWK